MAENTVRFRAVLDDKVSGPLGKIRDKFDTLGKGKGFKALAQGVGLGVGAAAFNLVGSAAGAAADFIGDSINAARDMTETLSKNKAVFGSSAQAVEDFGKTTTHSLGISKQASIEAAAGFGALFVGLELGQKPAADMSTRLVTLSGDLASFYNTQPGDALTALRSGLSGEAEPMRRFGVFLNEAKVKAKAMELGLVGLNGEVTEGAKVQARYALIVEETALAHGDAAKTIGELAGQQRVANAELADTQAQLGEKFEPIALQVTKWQIDFLEGLGLVDQALANFGGTGDAAFDEMDLPGHAKETTAAFSDIDRAFVASTFAGDRMSSSVRVSFGRAADASDGLLRHVEDLEDGFDKTVDELVSDAKRLIGDVYDPVIARDDLLANKAEANAARRVLASKTATTAEKRDASATLHQLAKDNLELKVELFAAGELNKKETAALFASLRKKLKTSTGQAKQDIQSLIEKLEQLGRVTTGGITVHLPPVGAGAQKKRAAGGPVSPFEAYTVGEEGPETLVMGGKGGSIVPNGAGGSVVVNLHFHSVMPPTPSEGQRLASAIGPELERWRRRQGAA